MNMAEPTSTRSASKRKHIEEPTEADNAATTRSNRVWFDDGNVVLQAEQTLFKVHKSILALHSTVFMDMFSMPQPPPEGETMVEGCPLVRVSDTAVDVTIVLEALFQRGHTTSADMEPLSIEVVAAFLRLGTKYDIDKLRTDAVKRLFKEYPLGLSEFDILIPGSFILDSTRASVQIDVVKLARDQGLLSVLPIALYTCCRVIRDSQALITGVLRAVGTMAKLSLDDTMSCLAAYQSLLKLQSETTLAWATAIPPTTYMSCTSCYDCTMDRGLIMRFLLTSDVAIGGLNAFEEYTQIDDMCPACHVIAENIHNEGRIKFWDALPGVFGLPDWEELKKERG